MSRQALPGQVHCYRVHLGEAMKQCERKRPWAAARGAAGALAVLLGLCSAPVGAGEVRKEIRPDPFRSGAYEIYEDGRRVGTLQKDPFRADTYELRDSTGQRQGEVRKDVFRPDGFNVFDSKGQRTGEVRPDPFASDRYRVYDSQGRLQGEVRKDPFRTDSYRFEGSR